MPPLNLWLVRHGQSTANAGRPATASHAEIALTELGQRQAMAVAQQVDCCPALVIVSPFLRARDTAAPLLARYPEAHHEIWPIGELSYLSAAHSVNTTSATRRPWVERYWKLGDPEYVDGAGAESFAMFIERLKAFEQRLRALEVDGLVVAVGHGQFFRAFTLGLAQGFDATPAWMRQFRSYEMAQPLRNGEILKLRLKRVPVSAPEIDMP
ncbi:histidine phosphatase family protein [Paraburkholderia bonniea]|uniref:histidine phosphatase family protein n=1 Tax=Paraburkholderia bonniea TaxID=2152891 RepID=UPI00157FE5D4|nr:histidine phosphatase family protein [Paraburkholderia bonniea]WJF91710.1 histidine phosphatase family protein [Paraburkholderia bonniea]WJF95030.1 histidine phosphatase family protein [Paraburkholderia bonniea]